MEPCRCQKCLEIINGPETLFRKDLEGGVVLHIANKPDGQPIYRAV
jgi:hypothetical protein